MDKWKRNDEAEVTFAVLSKIIFNAFFGFFQSCIYSPLTGLPECDAQNPLMVSPCYVFVYIFEAYLKLYSDYSGDLRKFQMLVFIRMEIKCK